MNQKKCRCDHDADDPHPGTRHPLQSNPHRVPSTAIHDRHIQGCSLGERVDRSRFDSRRWDALTRSPCAVSHPAHRSISFSNTGFPPRNQSNSGASAPDSPLPPPYGPAPLAYPARHSWLCPLRRVFLLAHSAVASFPVLSVALAPTVARVLHCTGPPLHGSSRLAFSHSVLLQVSMNTQRAWVWPTINLVPHR